MSLLSTAARTVADWVKLGFPESVAKRIVSGELPMDEASRMKRAEEQGYDVDNELYHGSTHSLLDFDGSVTNKDNDFGQGTYLTDDTYDASVNYAGEGADLTNRIERHVEMNEFQDFVGDDDVRVIGGENFTRDQWESLGEDERREFLLKDAREEVKGDNSGVIYPVFTNDSGVVRSTDSISDSVEVKGVYDYMDEAADDMLTAYPGETKQSLLDPDGEFYDELYDEASNLLYDDESNPNIVAYDVMRRYGLDDGYFELDALDTWQDLRDVMSSKVENGWYPEDELGEMVPVGSVMNEVMQELGLKGYSDMSSASRFSGMDGGAGNHTIMFPGSENQIRSVNAAFDPQYKGANILGSADPRLLAGIAAGGGGVSAATALSNKLEAAQAVKERGDIRAPNSSLLHDFTMGARDLERRLEGSPASLLFPEGLVEYLEQANRAERPNAATRSWALLDFL